LPFWPYEQLIGSKRHRVRFIEFEACLVFGISLPFPKHPAWKTFLVIVNFFVMVSA
jgi:hypothetical protein